MRVHFINLDRSTDRLNEFTAVNDHLADVTRFPAVDGQQLDIASLVGCGIVTRDILDCYTMGAVGCAMSHIALWDMAIESEQTLTICEDDTIFNSSFDTCAPNVLQQLPDEWDLILWGWNFSNFLCIEMLPGVSHCVVRFEQDRMRANSGSFQNQALSPRSFKLLWAFGTPSYTVSPKGARSLKSKLLPLRPLKIPHPEGIHAPPELRHFLTTGIDITLNSIYRHLHAFACFPPLVITKNEIARSTLRGLEETLEVQDKVLAIRPDDLETLNNRGLALHAMKRFEDAIATYDRALATQPDHALVLRNRGDALLEQRRFAEALASYDKALAISLEDAETLNNRGLALYGLKRSEEAIASYDRALGIQPDSSLVLHNRGDALLQYGKLEEALSSYDQVLAINPDDFATLNNRGIVLQELKRFDEALTSYGQALAARPGFAQPLKNRGDVFLKLRRFDEALSSYDQALAVRPDYAEALRNRGLTLHKLKRFDEALASYEQALAVRPNYAEALSNRGLTLHNLKRFDEALASYEQALTVRPNYAEALSNRGLTLHELKRFDEALASYEQARTARPDYAGVHFNEAICRLVIGDFDRGWEKFDRYINRYQFRPLGVSNRTSLAAIAGRTILLPSRLGFGDTIQFCRYVPLVAELAARVILEVQAPLHELMSTLPGAAQIVTRGDPLPNFDVQCLLESLPLVFGTRLETIPSATPYLRVPSQAIMNWNARLGGPRGRPRIGLAWSGDPMNWNDHNRSMRLGSLLSLFDLNATFVSLQKDVRAGDAAVLKARSDVLHFGDELKDFSDTAGLLSNLDLIISVDTSVVHLAGALAKPVWVMLPFVPDWRWLLDRDDSPWYPTARLFRQDGSRAWESVIVRVHAALQDFLRNYTSKPNWHDIQQIGAA